MKTICPACRRGRLWLLDLNVMPDDKLFLQKDGSLVIPADKLVELNRRGDIAFECESCGTEFDLDDLDDDSVYDDGHEDDEDDD